MITVLRVLLCGFGDNEFEIRILNRFCLPVLKASRCHFQKNQTYRINVSPLVNKISFAVLFGSGVFRSAYFYEVVVVTVGVCNAEIKDFDVVAAVSYHYVVWL